MLGTVSAGKTVPEIADIAAQCRRAAERLARIDTENPELRATIHRIIDRLAAPDLPHHLAEEPVLLDGGKTVPMGAKTARMPGTRILQRPPEV